VKVGDHIYVGPTLPAADVAAVIPGARLHGPVRHGDLAAGGLRPGDRVLLIDGSGWQSGLAGREEILGVIDQGIAVIGAAGAGAIRAAELSELGVVGVGEVFELYRTHLLTDVDEVTVSCEGPPGYRRLTEPLVNIRHALRLASETGLAGHASALALLGHARALPARHRSWDAIEDSVRRSDPGQLAVLALVRDYVKANAAAVDLMALDARLAIGYLAGHGSLAVRLSA
jgi:hypothetical protein